MKPQTTVIKTLVALWFCLSFGSSAQAQPAEELAADPASEAEAPATGAQESTAGSPPGNLALQVDTLQAQLQAQQQVIDDLKKKAEEEELAALLGGGGASAAPLGEVEEERLRFYGFMDFGFDKFFFDDKDDDQSALGRPTPASSFIFGNLNLYVDATPTDNWRTLFELRFTVAPHGEDISLGPPLGTSYERTDTLAFDFASPSAQYQLRLGGLFIERAWSEWTFSDLFRVRTGLFLNPFGIWNVDHGSPTLISLMLPTFIAGQMVPTRLLGLQLRGDALFGDFSLGYRVHLTNGRGPIDYDLTDDKAVGGRLILAHESTYGRAAVGTSFYWGTYDDREKRIVGVGGDVFEWAKTVHFEELVLAADLAVDVANFRLRSEAVIRRVDYEGEYREGIFKTSGIEAYLPNRYEHNFYAQLAYRTPWGLEPYVMAEVSRKSFVLPRYAGKARASSANAEAFAPSIGLNAYVSTHSQIKLQYVVISLSSRTHIPADEYTFPVFFARLVTSF